LFRRAGIAALCCLCLGAAAGAVVAEQAPPPHPKQTALAIESDLCAAPADLTETDAQFESVAAALKPGQSLNVLALGSATMLGPDRNTDASFPAIMVATLRTAVPGVDVTITVRGGRGMTAADMLPILQEALARRRYQLVVWQTGTVEAVRGLPPDDFQQTLEEGVQAARDAQADIVLVDPQFSRFLRANANLDPYLDVMRRVDAFSDAALFPRFDLMKYWADEGRLDMERAERTRRKDVARELHACIGLALARFVMQAAGVAQR